MSSFIYKLLLIAQPLLLYGMALNRLLFVKICSDVILVGSIILLFIALIRKKSYNYPMLLFWGIVCFLVVAFLLSGFEYRLFINISLFISMLSVWIVAPMINYEGTDKLKNLSTLCQTILLFFLAFQPTAYVFVDEGVSISIDDLTLGFNNPNLAGIIIFFVLILNICWLFNEDRKYLKTMLIVSIFGLVFLIYKTHSRASFFSAIFVLVIGILGNRHKNISFIFSNWFRTICLLFPIVFGILYVTLVNNLFFKQLTILGKPFFSGREVMFSTFWESILRHPIAGDMARWNFANAHNGFITIAMNIGLVGVILYFLYIKKALNTIINHAEYNDKNNIIIVSILAIFILSCSEASVLVAGNIFYVFFLMILSIISPKTKYIEESCSA